MERSGVIARKIVGQTTRAATRDVKNDLGGLSEWGAAGIKNNANMARLKNNANVCAQTWRASRTTQTAGIKNNATSQLRHPRFPKPQIGKGVELEPIMELQWLQGQLARTQKQVLEIVWPPRTRSSACPRACAHRAFWGL